MSLSSENRFRSNSFTQIEDAIEKTTPYNTIKSKKSAWEQFSQFLEERKYELEEDTSPEDLAKVLEDYGYKYEKEKGVTSNGAIRRSTYHGGYTYGMYSGNTSSKIYLRCSSHKSTGCRGKGYILRDKGAKSFVLLDEHCHPPNFLLERRTEIAKTMKEYAISIPGRPIDIYNSVVSIYPEVRQIWPFSKAVRTINRIRQRSGFMRNYCVL